MKEIKEEYASKMIGWDLKIEGVSAIKSNQKLLENVLRNLIDNAVKYGAKNIKLRASQDSKKTMISVIDDGVGIAPRHHKRIFRKFYRIPEPNNQHNQKGFGLGLHIVSSLIRKLGGKIRLESEPGIGSTFKITLPNG